MVLLEFRVMIMTAVISASPVATHEIGNAVEVGVDVGGLVEHMNVGQAVEHVGVDTGGSVEHMGVDVGVMVGQVVEHYLARCHLVVITSTPQPPLAFTVLRRLSEGMEAGVVVVEAGSVFSQDQLVQDHLLQGLWSDIRATCRGLVLDLTDTNNTTTILRFLEGAALWKKAEARVVVVGGRVGVKDVLLHHSLRNTVHVHYLALHDLPLHDPPRHSSNFRKIFREEITESGGVWVYRRCMYCNNGEADARVINHWVLTPTLQDTSHLFLDEETTLMGHKLRVVAVNNFPYIDFEFNVSDPGGIITIKDSIDKRLINTFAAALNFTYEIRSEPEQQWGLQVNGAFTGMMGQLQREETDLCSKAGPSPERLKVIEFLRGYPSEQMTVISLKPSLLPENLSFIRPFTGELWLAVLVSVVVWGVILWLLQRAWRWVTGGNGVKFSTAFMYCWAALVVQSVPDPPVSDSGRVLVISWLVFCLVITTGYSSSLIAHITIQGKTKPIETFEDLGKLSNWKWGTEPWQFNGISLEYFSNHSNPIMQHIYKNMERVSMREALKKTLQGHYSLITGTNNIMITIASYYTDSHGNTPFFISKKGVTPMAAYGWGFRKGAPFYARFHQLMSRLEDAGIIKYWTEDVIARRVRKNRAAAALNPQVNLENTHMGESEVVVLGMQHMQGAFYLLFLGCFFAILILLWENLTQRLLLTLVSLIALPDLRPRIMF
ncbi:glutamate receptor ionotropic, delta-1-like isoform X2 [Cherax quadricarinatus]|uniref:glutamate receptor ionotropic, delta-1-like isoform X2 n=1 Tax=Cherax quadricarinatus TaxID=27406 RepID=UPI00387E9A70